MQLERAGSSATSLQEVADTLVGEAPRMRELKTLASGVAIRRSTVMIAGETGSGKEMLARFIHLSSPRAAMPFVPVDCSSLTDTLFESELFGHVRGAFTGATRDSLGFIRAADGGTLFLDEIGELSLHLQSKLLRVLQEKAVVPVGETKARPVDIRVVTATNRDLNDMVRVGTFRQDLYFRLNVVALRCPSLRERVDDIVPLAKHFLHIQAELYGEQTKRIAPEVAAILQTYQWPGNVRELANVMEHAHVLATGDTVTVADLPPRIQHSDSVENQTVNDLCLVEVERITIGKALKRSNFNKALASRLLGINIQRLNRRISRLGIPVPV